MKAEYEIKDLLLDMGVSPSMKGFEFSAQAVELIVANGVNAFVPIFTTVYPTVAEFNGTTVTAVERGIRYVKERVFRDGQRSVIRRILGDSMSSSHDIPTNQAFLYSIAYYVEKNLKG